MFVTRSKSHAQFFVDFAALLEAVVLLRCPFVIGGDFNIHVEDPRDADAIRLLDILTTFGLKQHIREPTQQAGGTLDLVITPDDAANVTHAVDPPGAVSDHGLIVARLPVRATPVPTLPRCVRSWRHVDRAAFTEAIADSPLGTAPSSDKTADELFNEYDHVLTALANSFAPSRTVHVKIRPQSPWFDSECRSIRRNCRHLERRFRRSYADVDRLVWTAAVRDKNRAFEKKKADYWKHD